jgi:hypothetical protein
VVSDGYGEFTVVGLLLLLCEIGRASGRERVSCSV